MLENYLKHYLGNKEKVLEMLKLYKNQIDTPLLIEILKILQEELKVRIDEFERSK